MADALPSNNRKFFYIFLDEDQSKENLIKIRDQINSLKGITIISENDNYNFNYLMMSDKSYIIDAYAFSKELNKLNEKLQAAKKDGNKNGAGVFIAKLFKVIFICCDDFTQPKQIINNLKTLKELALSSSSELPFVSFTEEKFISYLFSNNIESINIILERLYPNAPPA